jgi:hypothetical protein
MARLFSIHTKHKCKYGPEIYQVNLTLEYADCNGIYCHSENEQHPNYVLNPK